MKKTWLPLALVCILLLTGCSGAGAKVISAEYVDSINTSGGVSYTYEGMNIIEVRMDVSYSSDVVSGLDPEDDNFRGEVFSIIAKGVHLYLEGTEIERTYGYWPEEASDSSAKNLAFFYVIPESHSASDLNFVFDGEVIGDEGASLDQGLSPK